MQGNEGQRSGAAMAGVWQEMDGAGGRGRRAGHRGTPAGPVMGPQRGPLQAGQILEFEDDAPVYFLPPEARTGKGAGRGRGCVLGTSSAGSLPAEPDEQERGCLDGYCGRSWLLLGVVIILGWVLTKTGG